MRRRSLASLTAVPLVLVVACGGGGDPIEDYYPELPEPTGEAQVVFAGQAAAGDLLTGPAATGLPGDLYIRNDVAAYIISAPTRVIGVIPQGGNVIDAVLRDASGQLVPDHFGELALLYVLGRTCEHETIEVIRDGAGGGIAAIRAHGHSGNDDFINFKGIGLFTIEMEVDPDIDDGVECATTYVLAPGSTTLEVYFTMYNPTDSEVQGPFGTLADTGGSTDAWGNLRGFERLTLSLAALSSKSPLDYTVFQGPGVSYGILPREPQPMLASAYLIAGVSVFLFGNDSLLDILNRDKYYLHLPGKSGLLQHVDLVVGRDGEDVDVAYRSGKGEALTAIGGSVTWDTGPGAPIGARVGVYRDDNTNGQIDDPVDGVGGDPIISYMDIAEDGTYAGQVPAGNLLVRAEVKNQGRSAAAPAGAQVALSIPTPIRLDFSIVDDQTNMPIPARLLVVGDHSAFPDQRIFETYDRQPGIVTQYHAIRGSSSLGADPDPAFYLPAGGDYRVYASRGTEWSMASAPFTATADGEVTLRLRRVAPATGYLSTEWHVHQLGSPDSPVPTEERLRSAVSAGIEMFAITDHDYITDMQPLAEQLGVDDLVRILPGIEVTPFAYGHFNAWPLQADDTSPNKGAIDWARGMVGYAMTPGEIYAAMRAKGAQMVQINHPRGSGFSEFQSFFDRAKLVYDYDNRTIFGDFMDSSGVPNEYLRLPGVSLWDDTFNGLEVWNGFGSADTDADGVREIQSQDRVMTDWFNMMSLGKVVTPAGNSDTHNSVIDPMGMPRTYVRVPDDSAAALQSGASVDPALATLTGTTDRDIVVTDGPMIEVTAGAQPAIGKVLAAASGTVTLEVTITSPEWAQIDTLEVFANSTPDVVDTDELTALTPLHCWTSRTLGSLDPMDRCLAASIAPESLAIPLVQAGGPAFRRYQATVTVTIDVADIVNRAGATGQDAWLVFRVRGDRGIFPVMTQQITVDAAMLAVLLSGDSAQLATALQGKGVPASAFTAPIFVDFDGGGYRAPFAP